MSKSLTSHVRAHHARRVSAEKTSLILLRTSARLNRLARRRGTRELRDAYQQAVSLIESLVPKQLKELRASR